jgi:predicted phage replisome organizer
MRERKYVKLRVDMHEDTKFKIIDMKPERDVIHYIWNRIVLLAGKVNLAGELYLSKSIPYTIETLAIEFNRDIAQIKLALQVFIELQMVELTEENIYKVKNFAKHQNIKVKEKDIAKQKEAEVNSTDALLNRNLEVINKASVIADDSIDDKINGANSQKDNTILFDTKKSKKRTKKKKDNLMDDNITTEEFAEEEVIDEEINGFADGDRPLGKDESIVLGWSFG